MYDSHLRPWLPTDAEGGVDVARRGRGRGEGVEEVGRGEEEW
jgi:hypothetical protein